MKLKSLGLFVAVVGAVAVAAIMWSDDAVQPSHAKETPGDVAAKIGDKTITVADLDERAKQTNSKVYQDLFDARNRALNELIAENLLKAEAQSRGITPDELVEAEIVQKVGEVSDADVEAFFKSNSARMGGRTLEQMQGQIRNFLQNESRTVARESFIGKLREKSKITVLLDPPRTEVAIAANDPRTGPDTAAVKIIEFSDFQ